MNNTILSKAKEEAVSKGKNKVAPIVVPGKEKRTEAITIKLTPSNKAKLKQIAEASNMKIVEVISYFIENH